MVFGYIYQVYHSSGSKFKNESKCGEGMSINHQSESISNSLSSSSHHSNIKRQSNCSGNLCFIYVLLGILCFLTITIATIFVCYVNRLSDLSVLRENLKNDYIFVSDIKHIVQIVLRDMKNEHQPLYKLSESETLPYGSNMIRNERKMYQMQHIMRERREASISIDNMVTGIQNEEQEKRFVEFFNPKIRRELEKKDEEFKKAYGYKGAAPGGDEWVWLTSYCRIPMDTFDVTMLKLQYHMPGPNVSNKQDLKKLSEQKSQYESITGFCSATKDYCPAGPAGVPGMPGPKGYRGDMGMPGPPGRDGRGPKGMPGSPGLDGRDGVPGEPGLDGVPGRAGADGIPGKDGIPGIDGKNGLNGKDGREGALGPQGPPGMPGERGITGPRGRTGRPGINGTPGIPGINAWKVKVNGTFSNELLIPPAIAGAGTPEATRPIIVHEGDHLRLRCAATGYPTPQVEWRREDTRTINVGAWQASSIPGHTLNITKINRAHMGAYQCLANNGIPPAANATFTIEVHFAPLIRVRNQYLYVAEGGSVSLECEIEAFPEALRFWKRKSDNRVLDQSDEYRMETYTDGYKSKMQLNITRIRPDDYGEYQCVSKNEVNTTTANFYVNDKSKPPNRGGYPDSIAIFGSLPPSRESFEDICGPPAQCPDCPDPRDFKCKDTLVTLYDLVGNLEIKPTENINYPGLPNRTFVGKPVYHKFTDQTYGSWLKDPLPKNDDIGEKIWTTNESDIHHIYEFANKVKYRNNTPKLHNLKSPGFRGNAHVVYNGSFYYQELYSNKVIRYDLESSKPIAARSLYKAASSGPNFLYTTEHNYIDFSVDDNGLWVIYSTIDSNNTHIVKLDAYTLEIQYSWNISINHHKVGEMFIVCGVLYAVDSVVERNTKIRLALDLYRNTLLEDVNLSFTNPFKRTTTVGYNHRSKELYTWDKGNQLTYPTRYHEIGYNISSSEKTDDSLNPQMQTGFDVYHDND